MATRTVLMEQMKAIVLPSLVQKINLSVRRAGQIPRPNALIRPSCVTGNKTARTALMKRTLAPSPYVLPLDVNMSVSVHWTVAFVLALKERKLPTTQGHA
jgi:uncharacterized protein with von Willebrand factor type A (vWA) domain